MQPALGLEALVGASGGSSGITLILPGSPTDGMEKTIIKVDNAAGVVNVANLSGIAGGTTGISSQDATLPVVAFGGNWYEKAAG